MASTAVRSPVNKRLGRPEGRESSQTRALVIQAARSCFVENGYGGTTLKSVATRADITPAAIYRYFSSKPVLYAAVFEEVVDGLLAVYRQALVAEGSFKDKLRMILSAATELHEQEGDATAILATIPIELKRYPELGELLVEGRHQLNEVMKALFQQAVDSGEFPKGYSADDLLLTFIGGGMGIALFQYGSGIGSMQRSTELLLELVERLY